MSQEFSQNYWKINLQFIEKKNFSEFFHNLFTAHTFAYFFSAFLKPFFLKFHQIFTQFLLTRSFSKVKLPFPRNFSITTSYFLCSFSKIGSKVNQHDSPSFHRNIFKIMRTKSSQNFVKNFFK